MSYSLGIDFGTNSVRALIASTKDGQVAGEKVVPFSKGDGGILLDSKNAHLARQDPKDHLDSMIEAVKGALADAQIDASKIVGIGVDTTGSTPLPVDEDGTPLALKKEFEYELDAMAWLWKDHTSFQEAADITALAEKEHPEYLTKCGGTYSSEWFWSKILRCARTNEKVSNAAFTWVEMADWIPSLLCGLDHPSKIKRGICAAGHKGLFHQEWGGYPAEDFCEKLHPELKRFRKTLTDELGVIGQEAGKLSKTWAEKIGLPEGIPVSYGALDAHLGGVGSGIGEKTMVKVVGTSTCDLAVSAPGQSLPDIPGISGIVPESILPGCIGLEAGQSAVGDIFNWFVERIKPASMNHDQLNEEAAKIAPGESGLLSLDWHNGNRNILANPRLTGLLVGMTINTTPAEMYRTWIEATAFGARMILEQIESHGVEIENVICCGGVSAKSSLLMSIYANVFGKTILLSESDQACALGSAVAGAVCGKAHKDFNTAIKAMVPKPTRSFEPEENAREVYEKLYQLYKTTHDAFGRSNGDGVKLDHVMPELLRIQAKAISA